jgi:murein L,D-transpeptidase YafK
MTLQYPKLGWTRLRRGGVVAIRSGMMVGFVLLTAALGEAATAQHALASAVPNDTTLRKATKPTPKREFTKAQMQNNRVAAARYEKRFAIKQLFRARGVAYPAEQVFIRIFKRERQLELWARSVDADTFALLKSYEICALSDQLGPKRKQGDMQTPEGFYYIDNFNPRSGFHLSLHINYPNESDRALGVTESLGGDIFIHGGCKTEGCMAVTDENIKEIYWVAVEARDNGQQRIPVHIFPTRLSDNNLAQLVNVFSKEPELVRFWSNLKTGYDYFAKNKKLPEIAVNHRGRYMYPVPGPMLGQPVPAPAPARTDSAKGN